MIGKVILITASFMLDGSVSFNLRPPVITQSMAECLELRRVRQLSEFPFNSEVMMMRICKPI